MKKSSRKVFLGIELVLLLILVSFLFLLFRDTEHKKTVAVIVNYSGHEKWNPVINGMKQAAEEENLHLIICNTDEIRNAAEERELIDEQFNEVDAFLIEPSPGEQTEGVLEDVRSKKPTLLISSPSGSIPCVSPDNYNMGVMLAEAIISRFNGRLDGKTIGLVKGATDIQGITDREEGFLDGIKNSGAAVSWRVQATYSDTETRTIITGQEAVDLMVVLETDALENVGSLSEEKALHGALVFGIGSSEKVLYDVDEEFIQEVVVPDGFSMGYQAVHMLGETLKYGTKSLRSETVNARLIRKEDLFKDENSSFIYSFER